MGEEKYFTTDELRVGCLGLVKYAPKNSSWNKKKGNAYLTFESVSSDILANEMQGIDIFTGERYNFFTGNNNRESVLMSSNGKYVIGYSVPFKSICDESVVSAFDIKLIICKLNIYDTMNRAERNDTFYLLKRLSEDIDLIEEEEDYDYFVNKFINVANKYCDVMMNDKDNYSLISKLEVEINNLNNEYLEFKNRKVKKRKTK